MCKADKRIIQRRKEEVPICNGHTLKGRWSDTNT